MEECNDPKGLAILKSFYEEVDKLKVPTVDAFQNKKYLAERSLRPDPRDIDPDYNKKQQAGYNVRYKDKDSERKRRKKERWESC